VNREAKTFNPASWDRLLNS